MTATSKKDARRLAGDMTRERLLDVTKSLIAERGEAAVSIRDIAAAAGTNIASVSYHFGSKDNLCRAAIEAAIEHVAREHLRAIRELPTHASVEQISGALASTILAHKGSRDPMERTLLAVSARAILAGSDQTTFTRPARELAKEIIARLHRALPQVQLDELQFRLDAAASILHLVAAGALDAHTAGRSRATLMRWIVAAVAGCLRGTPR